MANSAATIQVPEGFRLHTENTSHILLASDEAFLNPVQEFNRDTSVACIRVWSEELNKVKEERWRQSLAKKALQKRAKKLKIDSENGAETSVEPNPSQAPPPYKPSKYTVLEALSATGLRSIRYAKEIPFVQHVIANDLSPAAVEVMKRNLNINGITDVEHPDPNASATTIHVNEGDACSLMYNHRQEKKRVDVIDLDPYGSAAPFIDAAVQSIKDEGLLCVTCTDLAVLATTNFPEKCFSNYGGVPAKAEYCHESALRLVLHTISTSASRYGRYIEPLLSLSIDFYVRLFVRVHSSPIEVKKSLLKNSVFFICSTCQSHYEQPLGRVISKTHEPSNQTNLNFKTQSASLAGDRCPECHSSLHLAGPMWSGPLHDQPFVSKVLQHVNDNSDHYGTAARMKGMLTVAGEELNEPFYFTPSKVASFFHCETPSLDDVASALLNSGHKVSRSHACPGSLKTDASHRQVHDIFRSWIKLHPVRMARISDTSPAKTLLMKDILQEADFTRHPQTIGALESVKLVRYQENPANWGPGKKASSVHDLKRKRGVEEETTG